MALGVFLEKKVWGIIKIILKAFAHGKKEIKKANNQPTKIRQRLQISLAYDRSIKFSSLHINP